MNLREQIAGTCRHFTGVHHQACDRDVRYSEVTVPGGGLPCLRFVGSCPDNCDEREWPTPAQVEAEVEEGRAVIAKVMADLAAGRGPTCGADVEPREQVGRCIYAACGHRLGQGRLS
jgi:hypothetical protein